MMPERIALIRSELRTVFPALSATELDRLTRFMLISVSSVTIRAYEDYLGLPPAEASEDVAWAFRAIQRGVAAGMTRTAKRRR